MLLRASCEAAYRIDQGDFFELADCFGVWDILGTCIHNTTQSQAWLADFNDNMYITHMMEAGCESLMVLILYLCTWLKSLLAECVKT